MVKNRKLLNEELNRKSVEEFKKSKKTPIVIILDNIRSALNVGSVMRTADAFMVEKIYLCGLTTTPEQNLKEIHKTALGAEMSVEWEHVENINDLILRLKKDSYKVISIEQVENKVFLNNFYPYKNQKYALVFGNEVKGVSQEVVDMSDLCIEIPQLGHKHSFNIAVSAGIVMWHFANGLEIFD